MYYVVLPIEKNYYIAFKVREMKMLKVGGGLAVLPFRRMWGAKILH